MGLSTQAYIDAVSAHALTTGYFERVQGHEPKSSMPNGIWASVWIQSIRPARGIGGLNRTGVRFEFMVRCAANMLKDPQDAIDPLLVNAVDSLLALYSGDFSLGGTIMAVDLLGSHGDPLQAVAGYLPLGNTMYRVIDITLPLLITDVWDQAS